MEGDRRRVTLLDQMSAVDDRWSSLQGLTLDAILGYEKNTPPTGVDQVNRTLIDIFRDEPNYKDADREKKAWKTFREKLKLKRLSVAVAGAGTSSVHIPAPGLPIQSNSNCYPSRGSIGTDSPMSGQEVNTNEDHVATDSTSRSLLARLIDDSTTAALPGDASSSDPTLGPQIGCNYSFKLAETNTDSRNSINEDDLPAREGSRCLGAVFADSPVSGQEAIPNEDHMGTNPTSQPLFMLLGTASNLPTHHPEDSISTVTHVETSSDRSLRPQIPRHNPVKLAETSTDSNNPINEDDLAAGVGSRCLAEALADERLMSAREAIAAQEAAAEAAAAAAAAAVEEENEAEPEEEAPLPEPVRMSLMDLLEETDIQVGLAESMCTMINVVDEDGKEGGVQGGKELNCCICMIRSKGAAFIPCGHTFCRLCSRELWVQRGNCPLCNGFILEILDIF